jgi:hypothetical protein
MIFSSLNPEEEVQTDPPKVVYILKKGGEIVNTGAWRGF